MKDTVTFKTRTLIAVVGICTTLIAVGGALKVFPQIGRILLVQENLEENGRNDKDQEKMLLEHAQLLKEHGKDLIVIRTEMAKINDTIQASNRRTEDALNGLIRTFAGVEASVRTMERSVASAMEMANKSAATAGNAIVRADKALDAVEEQKGQP
jgi:hypothetical protein